MREAAWLRGPVEGVIPALQPVAHALIQAQDDLEWVVPNISPEELWTAPGGAASPGFHLLHLAESTDRLLTYARGESLSEAQKVRLSTEKEPQPSVGAEELLARVRTVFAEALAKVREVQEEDLDETRHVGTEGIPSNVRGLFYHMAEHATRHVGQLITTLNVSRNAPLRHGGSAGAESSAEPRGHTSAGARPEPR